MQRRRGANQAKEQIQQFLLNQTQGKRLKAKELLDTTFAVLKLRQLYFDKTKLSKQDPIQQFMKLVSETPHEELVKLVNQNEKYYALLFEQCKHEIVNMKFVAPSSVSLLPPSKANHQGVSHSLQSWIEYWSNNFPHNIPTIFHDFVNSKLFAIDYMPIPVSHKIVFFQQPQQQQEKLSSSSKKRKIGASTIYLATNWYDDIMDFIASSLQYIGLGLLASSLLWFVIFYDQTFTFTSSKLRFKYDNTAQAPVNTPITLPAVQEEVRYKLINQLVNQAFAQTPNSIILEHPNNQNFSSTRLTGNPANTMR